MGWSGYDLRVHVRVDAHGGEREKRGEELRQEFQKELQELCDRYDEEGDGAIYVIF